MTRLGGTYDSQLRRLVELYSTMLSYIEVSKTCSIRGFEDATRERTELYRHELAAYARRRYGKTKDSMAKAMDDVLFTYGQLTIPYGNLSDD